jgi:hypothetical protein
MYVCCIKCWSRQYKYESISLYIYILLVLLLGHAEKRGAVVWNRLCRVHAARHTHLGRSPHIPYRVRGTMKAHLGETEDDVGSGTTLGCWMGRVFRIDRTLVAAHNTNTNKAQSGPT